MSNGKPEIRTIEIQKSGDDLKIDIILEDCDARLTKDPGGITFCTVKGVQCINVDEWYRLQKNSDHILLEMQTPDKPLKSVKKIKMHRFAVYGQELERLHEQYGSMYKVELIDNDIKLVPVHIEEVKQLQKEIISLVKRYYNTEITLA